LLWLRKNRPEIFGKTKHVLLTNDYINYRLTGEYSVDTVQAIVAYHLYDPTNNRYIEEMSDFLEIDLNAVLPVPKAPYDVIGTVTKEAAEYTGLKAGTPVVCGTADGTVAMLETGITRVGEAADISGTAAMLFYTSDTMPADSHGLMVVPQLLPIPKVPCYLLGGVKTHGETMKWFTSVFGKSILEKMDTKKYNSYEAIDHLAALAPAGSGKLLYFPYLMGERNPLWAPELTGMFVGMSSNTKMRHFVRALLEGTSFAVRESTELAKQSGAKIARFYASGGCAKSDLWLKIKASMLKTSILVSSGNGGAPQGDAVLAGYGAGLFDNFEDSIQRFHKVTKTVEPNEEWMRIYDELYEVFISMRQNLRDDFKKLQQISDS
jgi:xylulokinase